MQKLFPSFLVPVSLQVRNWEHWNPIPSAQRQQFTQLLSEMSPHISSHISLSCMKTPALRSCSYISPSIQVLSFLRKLLVVVNGTDMPNWFPHNPVLLLLIIPVNLAAVPRSLAVNQEFTVPGAVEAQDIKISPRNSEPATRVSGGCKKALVNRKKK